MAVRVVHPTLEQNQQVPCSPAYSPLFGRLQRALLCSPNSLSPVAHVPEAGSPLLRQLLRAGHKRQREQDSLDSPPPQPGKRPRCSPVLVPSSAAASLQRRALRQTPSKAQEQVVPSFLSPSPQMSRGSDNSEAADKCLQRTLPASVPEGTKPFDLFSGDIFASREE